MEKKDMTADFIKEETRMNERKRFDERLERQGMAMYMALVGSFGAMFDKEIKEVERRYKQVKNGLV